MLKLILKTQIYSISIQLVNILVLFVFLKYLNKATYGEYVLYQGNLALFLLIFSQNLFIYTRIKISGIDQSKQFSYLKTSFHLILIGIIAVFSILFVASLWYDVFAFFGLSKIILQFLLVATLEIIIVEFIRFFLATKEVNKRNQLQLLQRLSFLLILGFNVFVLDRKVNFSEVILMLFMAQMVSIVYIIFNIDFFQFIRAKLMVSEFLKSAYRAIIPFLPIAFATTIINYTDRFLINYFLDINSLAEYGIIIQMINMSNMLIGMSIILPLFPYAVSAFNKDSFNESMEYFKKMMNYGLIFALLFSVFFVINYAWFFDLIGDGKYQSSDILVLLMSFNTVFYVIITTLSHYFQLKNKIRTVIIISVSCMLLNIGLNYTLIPLLGIVGSAISSISTLILMSSALSIHGSFVDKEMFKGFYFKKNFFIFFIFIILCSLILYGVNYFIHNSLQEIIIKNLIGLLLLSVIIFFNFKKELKLVMQKIQKRK